MASLTTKQGIIKKKGEDLTPERGFDLIIQEDQDYRFVPEDSPKQKKGLLSIIKRKKLKVFAVSNHSTYACFRIETRNACTTSAAPLC